MSASLVDLFREEEQEYLQESCPQSRRPNISQLERWMSLGIGGAMVLAGLSRGKMGGLLASAIGGAMVYRGATGHCYGYEALGIDTAEHNPATAVPAQQGIKIERTIGIRKSPAELFQFWRNFENLPSIMRHLKTVRVESPTRSHWVAEGIAGKTVEWDAEIINERENEMIAWKSLPGGDIETAGSVHFKGGSADRGTSVTVSMKYNPPGGKLTTTIVEWLGMGAEQKIAEDLRRFKQLMEVGEIARTDGQSRGSCRPSP